MHTALQQKLESLRNYHTRYEAIIILPSGEKMLLCYCSGKSFALLIRATQKRYDSLKAKFGCERFDVFKPSESPDAINNVPIIAYSGRTQRSAYCEGELKYFNE